MKKKEILLIFLFFSLDQLMKFLMEKALQNGSIEVIGQFFSLKWLENTGAAWSILENSSLFLIVISLFCLVFLSIFQNSVQESTWKFWGVVLLYAGILGNLVDRICFGYVKDYLSFTFFTYHFPVFNLADVFIVIGAFLFLIAVLKEEYRNGKNTSIRRRKRTN